MTLFKKGNFIKGEKYFLFKINWTVFFYFFLFFFFLGDNRTIAEKLKEFFSIRKSFSELFKKGIIEDPNLFGSSLIRLQEQSQRDVPLFVKKSIEEIEKYLHEPMIYGTSGNLSQIQSVRYELEQKCNCGILDQTKDVYILAGALKLFFRFGQWIC